MEKAPNNFNEYIEEVIAQYAVNLTKDRTGSSSHLHCYTLRDIDMPERAITINTLRKEDRDVILSISFAGNEFLDNPDDLYPQILSALLAGRYRAKRTFTGKKYLYLDDDQGQSLNAWQRVYSDSRKVDGKILAPFTVKI